jgi:2-hydroxychromene-2-carboxylate isomerase
MARLIEFYVDFISPFSYLALHRLPGLATRFGHDVDYKLLDLKEAKRLAGNIGPSTRDIPLKLAYARIDQRRWAKRYGIPIATPAHYDPLRLQRGFFFAKARARTHDYLKIAFHKVWGEGASMIDETMLGAVAAELGWDGDAFLDYTRSEFADAEIQAATHDAHARGVFGVPTMIIGGEMWWGNDRLDFVEEFLKNKAPS